MVRRGRGAPARADEREGRLPIAIPWIAACVALLVALPTVTGGFVWDDRFLLLQSPVREHPEKLAALVMHGHGWGTMFAPGEGSAYYRPLVTLLHGLLLILFGANPLPFRILSILLHAGGAFLLGKVLARVAPRAAWGAVVYAAHPALADAFGWISAAPDLAAAGFVFASLLAYGGDAPAIGGAARRLILGGILLAFGLLAKESAAVGLVWIPLFLWGGRRRGERREAERAGAARIAASLVLACALYAVVRAIGVGFHRPVVEAAPGVTASGPILSGNLFLLCLERIVFPFRPTLDPPAWAIDGGSVTSGVAGIVLSAALVAAAVALLASGRAARSLRGLALGVLLLIAGLLPALQIVPTNDVFAGRFLVLPAAGLCIGIGLALGAPGVRLPRAAVAIAAGVVLALAAASARRGLAWRDEETLFRTELAAHPEALRVRLYWSGHLINTGRLAEARPHVEEAARRLPGHPWVRYQQAILAMNEGRLAEAEGTFADLVRTWRRSPALLANLAACQMRLGRVEEGLATLDEATRDATPTPGMRNNRGIALRLLGRPQEAREEFERAIAEDPSYPQARWNLIALLAHDLRDTSAALAAAREAVGRFPEAAEAAAARRLIDSLSAPPPSYKE